MEIFIPEVSESVLNYPLSIAFSFGKMSEITCSDWQGQNQPKLHLYLGYQLFPFRNKHAIKFHLATM